MFLGVPPAEGFDHPGEVGRVGERLAVTAAPGADASVPAERFPSVINGHMLSIFRVTCYYPVMSDLTRDLYAYLMSHMYSVDHSLRMDGHWVMGRAWWYEICRLAAPGGQLPAQGCAEGTMFGLPVYVTDTGGIPHLAGHGIPPPGEWRPVRRY